MAAPQQQPPGGPGGFVPQQQQQQHQQQVVHVQAATAAAAAAAAAATAAAVAQYRVALGMGMEAYGPAAGLEDAYRPVAHGIVSQQRQGQESVGQVAAFEHMRGAVGVVGTPGPGPGPGPGQFGLLAPAGVAGVSGLEPEHAAGVFSGVSEGIMTTEQPQQQQQQQPQQQQQDGPSSRLVLHPPDLDAWREKLFNVDDTIVLTHEQFETYFPHVDNVYSHRSTQRYKRKPFVSHYWDCRMKGRPPGTPKSDDPNKKKRKRSARGRDLCDVKIKITEYLPGAQLQLDELGGGGGGGGGPTGAGGSGGAGGGGGGDGGGGGGVHRGVFAPGPLSVGEERVWTIQRVNGNGGNGKGDGVAGPHKHSLERSDEIKKNSVQRLLAKQEREAKKAHKPVVRRATGAALATARRHAREHELKLYAACFCPLSQRIWIALEAKGLAYQYVETDPFRRQQQHQQQQQQQDAPESPQGRIPAIQMDTWVCADTSVILEYLEDLDQRVRLLPADAKIKAECRLWINHINTHILPPFFSLLKSQDATTQTTSSTALQAALTPLIQAAQQHQGPLFLGPSLSLVDVHLAPFALRMSRLLAPLQTWPTTKEEASRLAAWIEALEGDEHVRATTSNVELYLETDRLWAECDGR